MQSIALCGMWGIGYETMLTLPWVLAIHAMPPFCGQSLFKIVLKLWSHRINTFTTQNIQLLEHSSKYLIDYHIKIVGYVSLSLSKERVQYPIYSIQRLLTYFYLYLNIAHFSCQSSKEWISERDLSVSTDLCCTEFLLVFAWVYLCVCFLYWYFCAVKYTDVICLQCVDIVWLELVFGFYKWEPLVF